MTKVSATQLKAHLGKYMREVRAGREVLVTDRDVPIARLTPVKVEPAPSSMPLAAGADPAAPPLGKIAVRAVRVKGSDTAAWLREERSRR